MEYLNRYNTIKYLFGKNFIGIDEINSISGKLKLNKTSAEEIPAIPFSNEILKKASSQGAILFLLPYIHQNEIPLTINSLRSMIGFEEQNLGVCFYNQDWYTNENFANFSFGKYKWCLIEKEVNRNTLSLTDKELTEKHRYKLPRAIELTFLFFSYFLLHEEILWPYNFIWCTDKDANCDSVYVGRYFDPLGVARNGFSVHRHLSITNIYGGINAF